MEPPQQETTPVTDPHQKRQYAMRGLFGAELPLWMENASPWWVVLSLCALACVGVLAWQRRALLAKLRDARQINASRQLGRQHAFLMDSPWMVAFFDKPGGRILRVNHAFEREIGLSAQAAVGRTAAELGLWEDPQAEADINAELMRTNRSMSRQVRLKTPAGQRILFEGHFACIESDQGRFAVLLGTNANKREIHALEREAIFMQAPVGIVMMEGLRVVQMNPAAARMYRCEAADAMRELTPQRVWPSAAEFAAFQSQLRGATARAGLQRCFRGNFQMQDFDGRALSVRLTGRLIDEEMRPNARTVWFVEDRAAEAATQALLEQARESAEAASAAKSAFVARMSHEIRTPLHALVNLHGMMVRTRLNKTQAELLDRMAVAQQALLALVNEVLDFSKIESGGLVLDSQPFFIASLLEEVDTVLRSQLRKQGVTLTISHSGTRERLLHGDANRLRQVLINLGSNAIKFTDKGAIRIRVQCDADPARPGQIRMYFSVQDTGIGMNSEVQRRIFKPFVQAHEGITRRYGGTGLGLAICAEIVRSMGGELAVESTEGKGSVFSFSVSLPQGQSADLPDAFKPVHVPDHMLATERQQPLHGLRVLVVDDNELNRFVTGRMLQSLGAEASTVGDGNAALMWLEQCGADLPDFVLMDVQMPVMDGVTATRLIRERSEWRELQVVALTGDVTVEQRDAIVEAGAAIFIAKPVGSERLAAHLRSLQPYPPQRAAPRQRVPVAAVRERSPAAQPAMPPPTLPLPDAAMLEVGLRELQRSRDEWQRVDRSDARALAALAHRTRGTASELALRFLWDASLALEKACKAQPHQASTWPLDAFEANLLEAAAWVAQQDAQGSVAPAR